MSSVKMDVEKYLERIGFVGPTEPSLEVLRSVHMRHLMSVPFENLTIHSGGQVEIEFPMLYNKIVNQQRGGFCCENNGLFYWLLSALGFRVTLLSAQVKNLVMGLYGPPFDHMVLMVTLEGQHWLCDVGFGSGYILPVSLDTSGPQEQGHKAYRIRKDGDMHFLECQRDENRSSGEDWAQLYKFTLEPRHLQDFKEMSQYHQSSPCSIIFCKSLSIIQTPSGRLSYIGRNLTTIKFPTEDNESVVKTTRELKDEEIPAVLEEKFGIVLKSPLTPKDEEITPPPVIY
ncbi:arylamine N-acetyltransferase, pineal gland isozyme NAT-3-like [Thalassophryne amazonica]|uniref:arylamine N-acetyltransferase, pineal gland isozyme NAT-3-like n=1 Tax=Thalassophryne amazonica TaxID=390379 RepID=UPI0014724892|nr:arylamine N-acetyltransferase, pineal gland isozyme NAT-3-like [Thalassophryne amazonica]